MKRIKGLLRKITSKKFNVKDTPKKIISIIIALLLIVGLWSIYKKDNLKAIDSAQQVNELTERIQKFYRSRPNAWGLNTQTVINEKIDQQILARKGQMLLNALDKNVTIGRDIDGNILMPGDRSFKITYWDLNKQECIEIATQPIDEKMQLSLSSITISNDKNISFSWGGENNLPVEKVAAKQACSNKNNITWDIFL